jgi:hypothetical protein
MGRFRVRLLAVIVMAMPLAACETALFFGYGLPANDACRDAASLPGKPIGADCLDSFGR